MLAYNHNIKFIPELLNSKSIQKLFESTITIKEVNSQKKWDEGMLYQGKYINNQGRNIAFYSDGEFSETILKQTWAFEVKDVAIFMWKSGTMTIEYVPQREFTEELLEYWALHILLPMYLTIENIYDFVHAGAVEVDNKPILFVAESFGGKSTMTDFFIKNNHPMISDDKVAILEKNNEFLAIPSHPHHRPYRKMEDLGYFVNNMASNLKPINAIYELERTVADANVVISEIHGIEKFKTLRLSSEMNFSFLKLKRFTLLSDLTRRVPVYKVLVPWNLDRLSEVYDAICEHTRVNKVGLDGKYNI